MDMCSKCKAGGAALYTERLEDGTEFCNAWTCLMCGHREFIEKVPFDSLIMAMAGETRGRPPKYRDK